MGTLTRSHTPFTMVSCHVLYLRCPFGYSGVNCEDGKYKSLALLLSTWKTNMNPIQNSVLPLKASGSVIEREGPACSVSSGWSQPILPAGHRQQHLCYRKSQNSAPKAGRRLWTSSQSAKGILTSYLYSTVA